MHIMRSKVEPATTRSKRLLEVLSFYSFNLYYNQGKDMILSDFLPRQKVDDSDPCELFPISFNMRNILQERYNNLNGTRATDKYLLQTRSQAKSSGVSLAEVHGIGKGLDPHVRPEKQRPISSSSDVRPPVCKPRIGHGRVGVRRRSRIVRPSQPNQTPVPTTKSMPNVTNQPQVTAQTEHASPAQTDFRQSIGPRIETRQVPFYHDPLLRLSLRPPDLRENRRDLRNMDMGINQKQVYIDKCYVRLWDIICIYFMLLPSFVILSLMFLIRHLGIFFLLSTVSKGNVQGGYLYNLALSILRM